MRLSAQRSGKPTDCQKIRRDEEDHAPSNCSKCRGTFVVEKTVESMRRGIANERQVEYCHRGPTLGISKYTLSSLQLKSGYSKVVMV